jgi:DNA replication protein DnaC
MFDIDTLSPRQRRWFRRAEIPARFWHYDLENVGGYTHTDQILDAISSWIQLVRERRIIHFPAPTVGLGLLLLGKPGQGKTTLGVAVLNELIRTFPDNFWEGFLQEQTQPLYPVLFKTYPEILEIAKRSYNGDEDARYEVDSLFGVGAPETRAMVLMIDDLGKEHRTASGWSESFFDNLLRSRFDKGLPTIVTSNVPFNKWAGVYGEPMASFAHEAFIPLEIVAEGGDRRL